MRFPLLCAVLVLTACGGPLTVEIAADRADPSTPEWLWAAGFDSRALRAARTAARVWGGSGSDLDGHTLRFVGGPLRCGADLALGCMRGDTIDVLAGMAYGRSHRCVEATVLAHEVGHVILDGDAEHRDPRWRDRAFWRRMSEAIAADVPAEDEPCRDELGSPGVHR